MNKMIGRLEKVTGTKRRAGVRLEDWLQYCRMVWPEQRGLVDRINSKFLGLGG